MPYLLAVKKDSRIFGEKNKLRELEAKIGTYNSQTRYKPQ